MAYSLSYPVGWLYCEIAKITPARITNQFFADSCTMAYLRSKSFKRKNDDKPRTYYYLVEAKRQGKKVQQKVVRYLGTADTIAHDYAELEQRRKKNT